MSGKLTKSNTLTNCNVRVLFHAFPVSRHPSRLAPVLIAKLGSSPNFRLTAATVNLFSILIADQPTGDAPTLPPAIARNIESFRAHHPDLSHRFFDQPAIRAFLRSHMEPDVLWAYDQLLPYAYRADLARLCLLHEFGGVYADLSVFFHASWPVRSGKLAVFRDRAVIAPWIVSNTIISAPPRFPAIEAAIRMIVAHCRTRYRGASPLCPTGPVLFGKAIAQHCEPDQIHLGEVRNAAGRDTTEALVFVDATDGRMIAYRTKTMAGLRELGLHRGVNNYNDFYHARLTYADDFPVTVGAGYLHQHGRTKCALHHGELAYHGDEPGDAAQDIVLCAMPFPFAAGSYRVMLDLPAATDGTVVTLFAFANETGEALARTLHPTDGGANATVVLALAMPASRDDIVIGIRASGTGEIRIRGLRIARLQNEQAP
jgi:hypothetical protein